VEKPAPAHPLNSSDFDFEKKEFPIKNEQQ
jgi:hypothetical protein